MNRKWKVSITLCAALPFVILPLIAAGGRQLPQSAGQNTAANTSGDELALAEGKALVGIGLGLDHAAVTAQAIANAGGLESIVNKGDTVILKPNLSSSRGTLTYPGNTDYRVVAEVVWQAREAGAGRIIIAEGAGTGEPLSDSTISSIRYNTIEGVEFLDLNSVSREDCYYVSSAKRLTNPPI